MRTDPAFWQGRRVLLTGHTGFKGAWATLWLSAMGAVVTGFARAPSTDPALVALIRTGGTSVIGDLADVPAVQRVVADAAPEIVLHMAAQPLVRASYRDPVETFATNVQGTVHLLDAVRRQPTVRTVLVVTTDKVYANDESGHAFREDDRLGGHDPYAASKAAAEIVVESYRKSFFAPDGRALVTARGGNVIGGGDFSEDRLVPDIIRAMHDGQRVVLRNPGATRPWQHVLDCLDGYFTVLQAAHAGAVPHAVNIGPDDPADTITVAGVAEAMARALGTSDRWDLDAIDQPHEMAALALDPTLARDALGWRGQLTSAHAIRLTADWYAAWVNGADMTAFTSDQIAAYQAGKETFA